MRSKGAAWKVESLQVSSHVQLVWVTSARLEARVALRADPSMMCDRTKASFLADSTLVVFSRIVTVSDSCDSIALCK